MAATNETAMTEDHPWVMFANCEVFYDGRASSTLARGNYLVVYKRDRSVSIHNSMTVMPSNYIGAGSKLKKGNNQIIFSRKGETVRIEIHHVHFLNRLDDWSEFKIAICRTEKELARKIFDNWGDYFDGDFEVVEMEFGTDLGPIDIAGFTRESEYLVEVKRRSIMVKDVTQLRRYMEARSETGKIVHGFIAAPTIGKRALLYLRKHGLSFLQVDFDIHHHEN